MALWKLPAEVKEKRSDERDVFTLLNALRAMGLAFTGGGALGRALFSTVIGRGDISTDHSGNEVLVIQFELPAVYDSFNVALACRGSDSVSTATFRVRLGGTWNVSTDGAVIVSAFANSSSMLVRRSGSGTVATGNTATLMKVTMQSSALNHTAQFGGGSIVVN